MSLIEMDKQFESLEKAFGKDAATAIMGVINLKVQKEKENAFDGKFRLLTDLFFVFAVAAAGFILGIVFMVLMSK